MLCIHSPKASLSYDKLSGRLFTVQLDLHYDGIPAQRDNYSLTYPSPVHSHFRRDDFLGSIFILDLPIARQLGFISPAILLARKTESILLFEEIGSNAFV